MSNLWKRLRDIGVEVGTWPYPMTSIASQS